MLTIIQSAVVLLLILGIWFILGMKRSDVKKEFYKLSKDISDVAKSRREKKHISIKKQIEALTSRKKGNFIIESFNEAKSILTSQRRGEKMSMVYLFAILSGGAGLFISIAIGNIYLIPPLTVGFAFIPIWVVKMSRATIRKALTDELETALSGITTSYMRTDNIIVAVEENLKAMNNPIKPVFAKFLNEYKFINSNVTQGLRKMKNSINHTIFSEWCDAIIQCQSDRSLKTTLFPIINKFSDIKTVQSELDTMMMAPFKEYLTITSAFVLTIPVLYILGREWFDILVGTEPGKIILSLSSVVIFIGINKAVDLAAPIEYRR